MPKLLTTATIRSLKLGQRKADLDGLFGENDRGIRHLGFRYRRLDDGRWSELRIARWRDDRYISHEGISLGEARERVRGLRGLLARGIDPKAREPAEAAPHTFGEAAKLFIAAKITPTCKRGEHAMQWDQSLRDHATAIMALPVDAIGVDQVLAVLEPIWLTKTPTASRLRGRIERILSYAKVRGWRTGTNPAVWRDNLEHALAAPGDVHTEQPHRAVDWRHGPALFATLHSMPGVPPQMVAFALLTGVRTKPVLEARWEQFDLDDAIWTVPPENEKTGIAHPVALSSEALAIVRSMRPDDAEPEDVVFYSHLGRKRTRGHNTLHKLMMKIGMDGTPHGCRATYRTWAKATGQSRDLAEEVLSHVYEGKAERAYTRDEDAIELQRVMMQAWADFLTGATIVPLRKKRAA